MLTRVRVAGTRCLLLPCQHALGHGGRGAADGVRHEEVGHGRGQRLGRVHHLLGRQRLQPLDHLAVQPHGLLHRVHQGKVGRHLGQPRAHARRAVVRQRRAQHLGQRAHNLPVLARVANERHRSARLLHAPLKVDVQPGLLRVGGARQDDVRARGALVTVVAHVHHKRVLGHLAVAVVVRTQQQHHLGGLSGLARGHRGREAQVERGHARRALVDDVEPVPPLLHHARLDHQVVDGLHHGVTVRAAQHAGPHHHRGRLGRLELVQERRAARHQPGQRGRVGPQVVILVRQVCRLAQHRQLRAVQPRLAQARVEHGRLVARVGADEQDDVRALKPGHRGVGQVRGAHVR
mmetsp:Transcript_29180/g.74462  ORF Transcript_29180/g.74462 Transcript_29180/m.74462 type:complete len:348 (+) Transcript_29180:1170-2213(+)